MSLTIHPGLIQGSDEWLAARRGILTASVVGQLITVRKLGAIDYNCPECMAVADSPRQSLRKPGAVIKTLHPARAEYARGQSSSTVIEPASNDNSRSLTMLLAAERITGWTEPTFMSDDMWRGVEDEPRARDKYSEHYAPATEVGFMTEDKWGFRMGYSPDGVVGDDGLIEVKSRRSKAQLATILADTVPIENMAQLQCGLLVSGRQWIDYVSYCGGMPLYVKRVFPQAKWHAAIIAAATLFESNAAEIQRLYAESVEGLHMTERTPTEMDMVI